ncbi:HAD-IB family phosphatase [Dactylosporangium roseum]|uniref:HAD-IB family phosphatase n=1 Tax=Dactylosporangium roseum TaxID=47989 RepID=A0ABY5ZBQ8_9ACTN|nr:HAD-IB family phosphatase [Dactylosporangium roseum]UWZ39548.1 HAD-IB family phosphatase [Dactylosporangium roseum]
MDLDDVAALHVFDMDGTLLVGTTASRQIASIHGSETQLLALERRFAAEEIDTRTFAVAIHQLWQDLRPEMVAAAFAASPWMTGVAEVCADIRARGEASVVITMSPDFFAGHLTAWGFDTVMASVFPALPFVDVIDPARILTPEHKVLVVDDLLQRHALPRSRCVAYGDSMSDAPLFRSLEATVAVNADRHLAGLAASEYRGDDLLEAYRLGRSHLDRA